MKRKLRRQAERGPRSHFDPEQIALVGPVLPGHRPANIITMLDEQIAVEDARALAAELAPLEAELARLTAERDRLEAGNRPTREEQERYFAVRDVERSMSDVAYRMGEVRARWRHDGGQR